MAKLLLYPQRTASGRLSYPLSVAARLHTVPPPPGVDGRPRARHRPHLAKGRHAQMFGVDVLAGLSLRHWVHSRCTDGRLFSCLWDLGRSKVWRTDLSHNVGPLLVQYRGLHLTATCDCRIPAVLPMYVPSEDEKLGPTIITDVSQEDQLRIRYLAYEEMKTFLSDNKVKYKSRKSEEIERQIFSGTKMFGTALALLANMDIAAKNIQKNFKVPLIFKLFLGHIHINGHSTPAILRESGSERKVLELKRDIEERFPTETKNYRIPGQFTVHDVSSTFKHFLSELPVPLITTEKIELFPEINSLNFLEKQLIGINLYIMMMNSEHRDSLECLLCFLSALVDSQEKNSMDATELAKSLALYVFKINDKEDQARIKQLTNILRVMIHYNVLLFYVPPQLISKVRYQYEKKEGPKPQPGLFGKKKTKEFEPDKNLDIDQVKQINVTSKGLPLTFSSIAVDQDKTAGEVVSEFLRAAALDRRTMSEAYQRRVDMGIDPSDVEEFHLYEMEGNIGHRLIHQRTKVLDVYRVNPRGKFVIAQRSKLH